MPECDRLIASFRAQSNVGEAIGCAHEAINALRAALLAAEARAKAMEDGPLDYMSGKCDRLKEENAVLEARVREVEAAFKKYGDHWGQCPAMTPRRKCNCGYDQARAILAREGA